MGSNTNQPPGLRHRWRLLLGIAWAVGTGLLTLTAVEGPGSGSPRIDLCLLCGQRTVSDGILNLLLFTPLGILVARDRHSFRRGLIAGASVAVCIETIQLVLPGRHSSLSDVVWNSLGAATGALAWQVVRAGIDVRRAELLAKAWVACLAVWLFAAGWLLSPASTDRPYWGQRTPYLGYVERYSGTVLSAELDSRTWPSGRVPPGSPFYEELRGDWTIEGSVVLGDAPPSLAPVLSVYDEYEREILLFGIDRTDLVLRERLHAREYWFDEPDLRIPHALDSASPGDTVRIAAERHGETRCLTIDRDTRCGLGFAPGRTWGLLLYPEVLPEGIRRALDAFWAALLLLPLGLLSADAKRMSLNGALVVVFVALASALTSLTSPGWMEVIGAGVGLGLGALWRARLRRPGVP